MMYSIQTQRLQNQQIEYSPSENAVDVLSHLGAIQGQDYLGAKWSLGLRVPNSTDADIESVIIDKKIVRTWLMRGTLFLISATDVRWLIDLIAPRVIKQTQSRYRQLELDEQTLSRSNDILLKALEGGQQLRRKQLYAILEDNGISTTGQRGVHIVRHTSLSGLILQTTVHNNNPLFMCVDDAIPDSQSMPRNKAIIELTRRYFSSRGLATLHDFSWWSGLMMKDARTGLDAIQSELVEEKIEDVSYWRFSDVPYAESPKSPSVYMLAGFDEYVLGYKNRDIVLAPEYADKVCPGQSGFFFPTIVIDGHICGIWKRKINKHTVTIDVTPFLSFTAREKEAIVLISQRYGTFLGHPVDVRFF